MSIPTPPHESSPKPMTPERLASIRHWANTNHGTRLNLGRGMSNLLMSDIKALIADVDRQNLEIERLRGWLHVIEDADGFYASELAGHALAGEAVRE